MDRFLTFYHKEELYRAIGDISDRHIINVRGRHIDYGAHSASSSSDERTIVMDAVIKKKRKMQL